MALAGQNTPPQASPQTLTVPVNLDTVLAFNDWTFREHARDRIKVIVKRILKKYGYPPDLQEEAVKTVLTRAELLCAESAG